MSEITGVFHVLNGNLKHNIEFDDSFLRKPHYLYETFRTVNGIPLFIEDHLDRFEHTLRLSNIDIPYQKEEILMQVQMVIMENNLGTGNIKMVFLPGNNTGEFLFVIYITPHKYPTKEQYMVGVPVSLFNGTRDNPNVKLMDCALRSSAEQNKIEQNVYEALLVDKDGYITEGSRSNIFFINNNKVITPPVDCILPGITRKHIINLCKELKITVSEKKVHKTNIANMDGVFISGTSRKVLPVNRVDKYGYPVNHLIISSLKDGFDKKVKEYLESRR